MKKLLALIIFISLVGCGPKGLNFKISYTKLEGLTPESSIIHKNQVIGKVVGIEVGKESQYLVAVSIKSPNHKHINNDSEFFITDDPLQSGKKAIEVETTTDDGAPIEENSVMLGMNNVSETEIFFKSLDRALNQGIRGLADELETFGNRLDKLPESKEFKELEQELNNFGKALGKAGKEFEKSMEKDLIPNLKKELDRLEKNLEEKQAQPKQPSPSGKQIEI